ncbi:MAG: hypothetical protein ABJF50_13945 [Paracoccaceae bacterium]
MNLSDLASMADIIAAAAIIVSLIFVGVQLRLTRIQSELGNWRDVLQQLTDYKGITNDMAVAELVTKGHADLDDLDPAERLSFGLYLEQGIHIYGNFLKHNNSLPRKLVGLDGAIKNSLAEMLTTPGGAAWWTEAHERGRFMPETYRIIDALLKVDKP